jgi:hypothetical protein
MEVFKLTLKLSAKIKILIFSFLTPALILVFTFTGCSKVSTSQQEITEDEQIEVQEEEAEEESAEDVESQTATEEITGNINLFSGLEISDTVKDDRPIAIMVENTTDARPQSGLINADIVFEVVDEYGITRFVTVFSSYESETIGPVRSARIYYAEIARSLDPLYAFWGTYPECYDVIRNLDIDVLDGNSEVIAYADSGWRDYTRSDITEHTAFMSTAALKEDAIDLGYSLDGGQSPLRFKADAGDSDRGDVTDITINFSSEIYKAYFEYDKVNNNYIKYVGGQPHTDYETGAQINVDNVIVMITDIEGPIDQYGHMVVRTTGNVDNSKAFFFMDGKVIEGTWERSSAFDPFTYKDDKGSIVLFNRGSTWIALIQDTGMLTY